MYSSEYEREKYVNDYIISNCVYDDEAAYNNNTKEMSVPPTEFLLTVKPYVKDMPGHFSFCATSSALNV